MSYRNIREEASGGGERKVAPITLDGPNALDALMDEKRAAKFEHG